MKKSILLATSALIASGAVATSAQAIDVELYGQVNKGIVGANVENDGSSGDVNIVDNDISSTRFGLRGNQQLNHGLTASVLLEGEMQDNASNTRNLDNGAVGANADGSSSAWNTRHARVGLGGQWGALFVGRTSSASDGVAEIDLSAAQDVSSSAADRIGGAAVVDNAGGITNASVAAHADNVDGIGFSDDTSINTTALPVGQSLRDQHEEDRANLVRFDTPIVQGLQGRVAYTQDQTIDAAVLYNNSFSGFEVAGGASYVSYDADATNFNLTTSGATPDYAYSITASVKHESGVSGTLNYGERKFDGLAANADDPNAFYGKLGYQYNNTGFAVDYTKNDDAATPLGATSSDLEAYGAYVQQDLGHGVSASAYGKRIETELNGTEGNDLDLYGVNMRVKF